VHQAIRQKNPLKSEQIDMSHSVSVACAMLACVGEQYLEVVREQFYRDWSHLISTVLTPLSILCCGFASKPVANLPGIALLRFKSYSVRTIQDFIKCYSREAIWQS